MSTHVLNHTSNDCRFSYADLTSEQAAIAQNTAATIRMVATRSIREIGSQLLKAKAALPHGMFIPWVSFELGMTRRSATNYMRGAEWLDGKPEMVSHLPQALIYQLASPSVPEGIVCEVVARAEAGSLNPNSIRNQLEAAKENRAALSKAQRRTPELSEAEFQVRKERRLHRETLEDARREKRNTQQEQERQARLRPLAERLETLGTETVEALCAAMDSHADQRVLSSLLRKLRA